MCTASNPMHFASLVQETCGVAAGDFLTDILNLFRFKRDFNFVACEAFKFLEDFMLCGTVAEDAEFWLVAGLHWILLFLAFYKTKRVDPAPSFFQQESELLVAYLTLPFFVNVIEQLLDVFE